MSNLIFFTSIFSTGAANACIRAFIFLLTASETFEVQTESAIARDIRDSTSRSSSSDYSVSLPPNADGAKAFFTLMTSSFLLLTITPMISPPLIPPDTLDEAGSEPETMASDASSEVCSVSLSLNTFGVIFLSILICS